MNEGILLMVGIIIGIIIGWQLANKFDVKFKNEAKKDKEDRQ